MILDQLNILLSHSTTLSVLKLLTKSIKHTQFKFTNSKEFPNIIFYTTSNMQCLIYFWLPSSVTIYILIIIKQMQENQILQKYFFLINLFIFIPLKKKKSVLCKKLINLYNVNFWALLIVRQYALHSTCVKILIPNKMCLFNT